MTTTALDVLNLLEAKGKGAEVELLALPSGAVIVASRNVFKRGIALTVVTGTGRYGVVGTRRAERANLSRMVATATEYAMKHNL